MTDAQLGVIGTLVGTLVGAAITAAVAVWIARGRRLAEDRHRFATEKRLLYADILRVAGRFNALGDDLRDFRAVLVRRPTSTQAKEEARAEGKRLLPELEALRDDFSNVSLPVELVAPTEVAERAAALTGAALKVTIGPVLESLEAVGISSEPGDVAIPTWDALQQEDTRALNGFLKAARLDLGVPGGPRSAYRRL